MRFAYLTTFVILLWMLSSLEVFRYFNNPVYDFFVRHKQHQFSEHPVLLLLVQRQQEVSLEEWKEIYRQLHSQGARGGFVTSYPQQADPELLELIRANNNFQFGHISARAIDNQSYGVALPKWTRSLRPKPVLLPSARQGVVREFNPQEYSKRGLACVECETVAKLTGKPINIEPFLISYGSSKGSIPILSSDDLLNNYLSPNTLTNKFVVIADEFGDIEAQYLSPVDLDIGISFAQYLAYVFDSMITQTSNTYLSGFGLLALMLAFMVLSSIMFLRTSLKVAFILVTCISVIYCVSSWLILSYLRIFFPLVEPLFVMVTSGIAVFTIDWSKEKTMLRQSTKVFEYVSDNKLVAVADSDQEVFTMLSNLFKVVFDYQALGASRGSFRRYCYFK